MYRLSQSRKGFKGQLFVRKQATIASDLRRFRRRLGSCCWTRRLGCHESINHRPRVLESWFKFFVAAVRLEERQTIGAHFTLLIDVRDGNHEWTQDDLSVVLKEVHLKQTIRHTINQSDSLTSVFPCLHGLGGLINTPSTVSTHRP